MSLGQLSRTSGDFKSWTPKKEKVPVKKTKKQKLAPKEIHPHFTTLSTFLKYDEWWENILINCSYGKFPVDFKYQQYTLSYKKGASTKYYTIEDDSITTAKEVVNFFRTNGGLFSSIDREREVEVVEHVYVKITWGSLSFTGKQNLIKRYVEVRSESLSPAESKQLLAILNLAIIVDEISSDDVVIKKNEIVKIRNLKYENGVFYCGSIRPTR
jgi:hypothetical protein